MTPGDSTVRPVRRSSRQKILVAVPLILIAAFVVILCRLDHRRPAVRFLGFTDVLNRRVARFVVSNSTDRAFTVTTSPDNGYVPMPVEPGALDYVDVPNPHTNRFWPAELHFQIEIRPWRQFVEDARTGHLRDAGVVLRRVFGTNRFRYFLNRPALDFSQRMDD